MKKILFIFSLVFSMAVFAQSPTLKSDANLAKKNGTYLFEMPSDITSKQIKDAANYYTKFFTVTQNNNEVTIKMVDNTVSNRHVMKRFFISLNQRNITIDGSTKNIDLFFEEHIL